MIELKDVSFTYESGETENNLSHINLAIQDGETILLCGESGCGKTTLTRLRPSPLPSPTPLLYESADEVQECCRTHNHLNKENR